MKSIQNYLDIAEKVCYEHGSKLTAKRKEILSILLKEKKALSAYEIIHQYEIEFGSILKAMSVYRILEYLQGKNLVHRLSSSKKYIACVHEHSKQTSTSPLILICTQCQDFKEITIESSIFASLTEDAVYQGFHFNESHIELGCVCSSCQNV